MFYNDRQSVAPHAAHISKFGPWYEKFAIKYYLISSKWANMIKMQQQFKQNWPKCDWNAKMHPKKAASLQRIKKRIIKEVKRQQKTNYKEESNESKLKIKIVWQVIFQAQVICLYVSSVLIVTCFLGMTHDHWKLMPMTDPPAENHCISLLQNTPQTNAALMCSSKCPVFFYLLYKQKTADILFYCSILFNYFKNKTWIYQIKNQCKAKMENLDKLNFCTF